MPVTAFEGPAGTGKTHSLMARLADEVERYPLDPHERVLALSYMHGSRRQLHARLHEVEGIRGRFEAMTLDSFAWRLCRRWRPLARSLGHADPTEEHYDSTCACAAALLAQPVVTSWVRASYPFVVVDEAQDLSAERSKMIQEVSAACHVLLAFDEFQCLNPALLPTPIQSWLPEACEPVRLDRCRRTGDTELLEAARAVRNGRSVNLDGSGFQVRVTPGHPNHAAAHLAGFIAWRRGGGTVAVLTPSRSGGFANKVVGALRSGPVGQRKLGPFSIEWESSGEAELEALWRGLAMPETCSVGDALARLEPHRQVPPVKIAAEWIRRQLRVLDVQEVRADEIRRRIERALALRRHHQNRRERGIRAMTIQQAKNREFDHVAVVWPYTIPNDDEQKRRLLYNAITRAKRRCLVLVQAKSLATALPFVG